MEMSSEQEIALGPIALVAALVWSSGSQTYRLLPFSLLAAFGVTAASFESV